MAASENNNKIQQINSIQANVSFLSPPENMRTKSCLILSGGWKSNINLKWVILLNIAQNVFEINNIDTLTLTWHLTSFLFLYYELKTTAFKCIIDVLTFITFNWPFSKPSLHLSAQVNNGIKRIICEICEICSDLLTSQETLATIII